MKAYTDIPQSKKLAEILRLESADMHYNNVSIKGINYVDEHRAELMEYNRAIKVLSKYSINPLFEVIPCWSLTALLNYIKDKCGYFELVYLSSTFDGRANKLENVYRLSTDVYDVYENELIDACYEMILKLHELKLL